MTSRFRPNSYYNLMYNIHSFGERSEGINPCRGFRDTAQTVKLYTSETYVSCCE